MKKQPRSKFIDITKAMEDSHGNVRKDIFLDDMLHLTPEGYTIWAKVIYPYLK